jgi:hypothetical protein
VHLCPFVVVMTFVAGRPKSHPVLGRKRVRSSRRPIGHDGSIRRRLVTPR